MQARVTRLPVCTHQSAEGGPLRRQDRTRTWLQQRQHSGPTPDTTALHPNDDALERTRPAGKGSSWVATVLGSPGFPHRRPRSMWVRLMSLMARIAPSEGVMRQARTGRTPVERTPHPSLARSDFPQVRSSDEPARPYKGARAPTDVRAGSPAVIGAMLLVLDT